MPEVLLCLLVAGCASAPPSPPPSPAPAALVDEAHAIIEREFLDPAFGGKEWSRARPEAPPRTREEAWAAIRGMLKTLDEPATRLLEPEQRAALERELTGTEGTGVGLPELLSVDVDERTRELVVVTPLRGSPASRVGLRPRDVLLDVRGNPGGLLMEALDVAGQFLGPEPVATLAGRPERTQELKAGRAREVELPLVVLVDEGTASAAEMLAGALQAHGRARLVGARTFGKGLLHNLFPLSDGSALLVSVGRIVTPKGRDILAEGIEPDVSVPGEPSGDALPGPQDARYQKALELLGAQQQRPPPPR
jgi:C-terminal processing protease CtpA/Prc